MILRLLEPQIEKYLFRGRTIILYGARRVGKTTLVKKILENNSDKRTKYVNCDLESNIQALSTYEADTLQAFLGTQDLVVLDEAQNIPEVGRVLKILVDEHPEMQVIAAGSSSFDLVNKSSEPMTGRMYRFKLYPFSVQEIAGEQGVDLIQSMLERLMRFGLYPDILDLSEGDARIDLEELTSNYLYRDVLAFAGIRKSTILTSLLQLIALQLGNEVNYNELATKLGIDRKTVVRYIDLLEQCFVLFRLRAFSRSLDKEVSKSVKIYFYDLGVRNSLIQSFAPLSLRTDVGALWENFCIIERLKYLQYHRHTSNQYFWRTYDKKEIDYIEESDGLIRGFEFKWGKSRKIKIPQEFLEQYPGSTITRVDRSNYWDFLSTYNGFIEPQTFVGVSTGFKDIAEDPLVGMFEGPENLSQDVEEILQNEIVEGSGFTWKT